MNKWLEKRESKKDKRIDIAKLHFIADSMPHSFWGSNQDEQDKIDLIRKKMEDYLYVDPPQELFDELAPIARELLADPKFNVYWEMYLT